MKTDTSTAIVAGDRPGAIQTEAATILDVISRAAKDPSVNVEKLERLLAIQERLLSDQRRTAYMAAKARLQARLPQIAKQGHVIVNGQVRSKFARIEDVDTAIRPLCAEEGFAFSFDSRSTPSGIEYSCELSHRDGYSETKTITLPADTGPGRNSVQAVGSTTSYARRYLLAMHLNLVTRDEDDDGAGGQAPVTPEQAATLRRALEGVGGDETRFLRWIDSPSFEAIRACKYDQAMKFIDEKRKRGR